MRGGRASWSVTRGRFRPVWYNLLTTSVNIDSRHRWPAKSSLVLYGVPRPDYPSAFVLFCFNSNAARRPKRPMQDKGNPNSVFVD
jgi:hypothetical protein